MILDKELSGIFGLLCRSNSWAALLFLKGHERLSFCIFQRKKQEWFGGAVFFFYFCAPIEKIVKIHIRFLLVLVLAFSSGLLRAEGVYSLLINEIMPANVDRFVDPSWNYGGWIEIYNPGDTYVQLRNCWLSDDPGNLKKVHITQSTMIRSGGFVNLWFEHHDKYKPSQIDMKLDQDGGTIYLSDSKGELILQQDYPPAIPRASYARKTDGADEWGWTDTPTPAATNGEVQFCQERLPAPELTKESQLFSSSLITAVSNIPEGATLRYTTNGSTPTLRNGETSLNGIFVVRETTVYRFAFFKEGYLSSQVVTRSYIKRDKNFTLPIMSIVSDPVNLYNEKMGVFVRGVNGRPGLGQSTACNWNMDWDRPVNFELLDAEGKSLVNQEAGLARCGGWSRSSTPYSFKINATKLYEGQNTLDYQFFDSKPYQRTKSLQIRNGGNDNSCRVRDPFLQELIRTSGVDLDCQAYTPVCHYINGVYKGVINLREPNNNKFVYANYGLDKEEIDLFEIDADSGYCQLNGTREAFEKWYKLSKTASNASSYEQIHELVDIDEFCNYMAAEMYLSNWDWPQNNVKAWRPIMERGRFRFIVYDIDGAFGNTSPFSTFADKRIYSFNQLYGENVDHYTKEIELVTIFQNMLNNADFRKQFIDAFCLMAGSVFEPTRCQQLITKWANRVADMQVLNDNGYGKNESPWATANSMISSLNGRANILYSALKSYSPMKLSGVAAQQIVLGSNLDKAKLEVNGQAVPTGKFDGQLFPPVRLKAEAPAGFEFQGWQLLTGSMMGVDKPVFPLGSKWRYSDRGNLDGTQWKETTYDDSGWKEGNAPLGYASSNSRYNTVISYGGNSTNKYITYYFRKVLHLDETPGENDIYLLNYMLDDGMVVYVNGKEAGRFNMPIGTINFNTVSSSYAGDEPFAGSITLDTKLLKKGDNVIAVEVHNNSNTSSDIYWDASVGVIVPGDETEVEFVSVEPEIEMPASSSRIGLKAYFKKKENEVSSRQKPPVVINEVSAGNSVNVNEYFKKNDWIELYNTTGEDIDLEGMYLSDSRKDNHKAVISSNGTAASTVIPAYGYKIVWCDGLETRSQLHVDFKLSNEDGKRVVLTAQDDAWADTLIYCAHDGGESVGRYPDGADQLYLMTRPSIDASNRMNSYTTPWEAPEDADAIPNVLEKDRNGGLSIACVGDELLLKSEETPQAVLCVYSVSGQIVLTDREEFDASGHKRVSLKNLPAGVYVARLSDTDGNRCATKFTRKEK